VEHTVRDDVVVPVDRLTDGQLRELAATYEQCAEFGDFPEWGRRWYRDLAAGIRGTLTTRTTVWLCLLADPAVPPSWDVAVAALPPEASR
jgi:hypothetical protein